MHTASGLGQGQSFDSAKGRKAKRGRHLRHNWQEVEQLAGHKRRRTKKGRNNKEKGRSPLLVIVCLAGHKLSQLQLALIGCLT